MNKLYQYVLDSEIYYITILVSLRIVHLQLQFFLFHISRHPFSSLSLETVL